MNAKPSIEAGTALLDLLYDAFSNHKEITRLLCMNPDLTLRNARGETALLMAAVLEQPDTLDLLVKAGADINARVASGNTALMLCIINGDQRSTDILIRAGADPSLTNNHGQNVFDLARDYEHPHLALYIKDTLHSCAREEEEKRRKLAVKELVNKGCPIETAFPVSKRLKPKPPTP